MLNAWAKGQKVLFSSTTNNAVDVVRERLERFENDVPVAVRAGSHQHNRVQEVIRRIQNLMSMAARGEVEELDQATVARKRDRLVSERKALENVLASNVPQRVDQAWRSAMGAYAEHNRLVADLESVERGLRDELGRLGYPEGTPTEYVQAAAALGEWLTDIERYERLVEQDNADRKALQAKAEGLASQRDKNLAAVGCEDDIGVEPDWLLSGAGPSAMQGWIETYRAVISEPWERSLEPYDWNPKFKRWRDSQSARTWLEEAEKYLSALRVALAELAPKVAQVTKASIALEEARNSLLAYDVDDATVVPATVLKGWSSIFAHRTTRVRRWYDSLPLSPDWFKRRRQSEYEATMQEAYPLVVWENVGALDDEGRARLARVVEATLNRYQRRKEWNDLRLVREEVAASTQELRKRGAALALHDAPQGDDPADWKVFIDDVEEWNALCREAVVAWEKREAEEEARRTLLDQCQSFERTASGVPVKLAWSKGPGADFVSSLRKLGESPAPIDVVRARELSMTPALQDLTDRWSRSCELQQQRRDTLREAEEVPNLSDRVGQWWVDRPRAINLPKQAPPYFPTRNDRLWDHLRQLTEWGKKWVEFDDKTRPEVLQKAQKEAQWAGEKLSSAIEEYPEGEDKVRAKTLVDSVSQQPIGSWPVKRLEGAFKALSPVRIKARIQGFDADLERISFDQAKAEWVDRNKDDSETLRALDELERRLKKSRGRIEETDYQLFRRTLDIMPVWITTAQSTQSVPMEPGLFDLVVIDEASQCTLTNLLPLLFRGKRVAVIGDKNQLPAIPHISGGEERMLAQKHGIGEWMGVLGHAHNNVYDTGANSLPRGHTDVIDLTDHYRSHPLIIGFANQLIYNSRLRLKRELDESRQPPRGGGVHGVKVPGRCQRGPKNRSWVNHDEAEAVVKLVKALKDECKGHFTIGIVAPFRPQKDLLDDMLIDESLSEDITVGTAHTFQGDERDIMIFSMVASRGMTPSAVTWMGDPPNLVNVAVTRARESLFVVGDFDFCRPLQGIVGDLVRYCDGIEKIRRQDVTSHEELDLYAALVLENMHPQVHPIVGDIEVDFTLEYMGTRLAVEVDGTQHQNHKAQDASRDAFLAARGFEVLRVPAREVRETPALVLQKIRKALGMEEGAEKQPHV